MKLPDIDIWTSPRKLRKNTPESRAIMQTYCLRSLAVSLEMIANVIADESRGTGKSSLDFDKLFEALRLVSVRAPAPEKEEKTNETT